MRCYVDLSSLFNLECFYFISLRVYFCGQMLLAITQYQLFIKPTDRACRLRMEVRYLDISIIFFVVSLRPKSYQCKKSIQIAAARLSCYRLLAPTLRPFSFQTSS